MRLLITAGATREPLDAVRFLSNVSTGTTGAALADEFARRGHEVTLLRGTGAALPAAVSQIQTFTTAADLRAQLQALLAIGGYDAVVMTAAVADYRPAQAAAGKLSSAPSELTVQLVRNEKILPQLKSFAPRPLRVIGFKLTADADDTARRAAVATQFAAGGVDAVVHNDLSEIRAAALHPFAIYRAAATTPQPIAGVPALAEALGELLQQPI